MQEQSQICKGELEIRNGLDWQERCRGVCVSTRFSRAGTFESISYQVVFQ